MFWRAPFFCGGALTQAFTAKIYFDKPTDLNLPHYLRKCLMRRSWPVRTRDHQNLEVFGHFCLGRIVRVSWQHFISNTAVWIRCIIGSLQKVTSELGPCPTGKIVFLDTHLWNCDWLALTDSIATNYWGWLTFISDAADSFDGADTYRSREDAATSKGKKVVSLWKILLGNHNFVEQTPPWMRYQAVLTLHR